MRVENGWTHERTINKWNDFFSSYSFNLETKNRIWKKWIFNSIKYYLCVFKQFLLCSLLSFLSSSLHSMSLFLSFLFLLLFLPSFLSLSLSFFSWIWSTILRYIFLLLSHVLLSSFSFNSWKIREGEKRKREGGLNSFQWWWFEMIIICFKFIFVIE